MRTEPIPSKRLASSLLLCLCLLAPAARARQSQTPTTPTPAPRQDDSEEVVRVSAELVQTDVMVFDKSGKFVDGLKPEQFELRVDDKPQPIIFFERIQAGTLNEDAQLAAARGGANRNASAASGDGVVQPLDRGRSLIFFVDDLHLSPPSASRARTTIQRFIDDEMKQNDEAAIYSATGQVGFLQQMTGDRTVLRAALSRVKSNAVSLRDADRTPMTEVQARAVEQNDLQVTEYFVTQLLREFPNLGRESALNTVRARARTLMQQINRVVFNTFVALEHAVRNASALPGRKLIFFISDGFMLNVEDAQVRDRLRRITDAAARSGVVVYTMDARGLTSGMPGADERVVFDPAAQLVRIGGSSEVRAMQEPLHTLAAETGGRALLNTNSLDLAVTRALKETSVYYLLAWRPEAVEARGGNAKFRRIEVSVKDRPDLQVSVRRGFYTTPPPPLTRPKDAKDRKGAADAAATTTPPAKSIETELFDAVKATYPRNALPTSLALGYVNAPNLGMVLTASIDIEGESLSFTGGKDGKTAVADVIGAVFDDQGKLVRSSKHELGISPTALEQRNDGRRVIYSVQYRLMPGLFQVRVAARDRTSGRTGSAMQWVEIPDLKEQRLALSSIFLGERTNEAQAEQTAADGSTPGVMLSADRRFARTSWIRFVTYIYNAAASGTPAQMDVALQVQVFRDDQPVITAPLRKVDTTGVTDLARIPYAAEIPLETLPVGRYVLQVTAIDRAAKSSASQRVNFIVE
ncbi:MAG TPA: VWA domain-containing protein [Pyrinomonadaceae bacterium]|nr:VWA domain-containing protein [Pyrinomonadaceae bacterium]